MEIFQKVKTPNGIGTVVSITTPFNGLYISREKATCVVWYGMEREAEGRWVSKEFSLRDIESLNILPA